MSFRPRVLLMVSSVAVALLPCAAQAQTVQGAQVAAIEGPIVIVTAQKEPAEIQTLPLSVTSVTASTIANAGIAFLREAAIYSPNTYLVEFTARKLSNPYVRGIGSSPNNPAVTTYLDGVPQLNANSSSIDLVAVERIEFVRGAQGALFGRNTIGGTINVVTARPSLTAWGGSALVPLANHDARDIAAGASGPLAAGRVGVGFSLKYGRRDGFTDNAVTGNDVDYREAFQGRAQLLWAPSPRWEARFVFTGERTRDGDYTLSDVGGLRQDPFTVAHDFEGHTDRDITSATVLVRRAGGRVNLSSTTGLVKWKTLDATDLDYTPFPLLTRNNAEESVQFTQEIRLSSAADAAMTLGSLPFRWQAGAFLFSQNYDQDASRTIAPFVFSPLLGIPLEQHTPAALDDIGIGLYGQGTFTFASRLDVGVGARFDHETKEAQLRTFTIPALSPERLVDTDGSFSDVSPQLTASLRIRPDRMVYASVGRGFKAGGFNAESPAGSEAFGVEHSWNVEGGIKTTWMGGRIVANAAVFRIDWSDLQLNVPDPFVPGQFYVANAGDASSTGVELEFGARVVPGVELFAAVGTAHARFGDGSLSGGVDVSGNELKYTPDYTATFGTQITHALRPTATLYGRAELTVYGPFMYDDTNLGEQPQYSLANLRAGVRSGYLFVEAWVRNAFDTHYVPLAIPDFTGLAPSGFLGESGAPRTFGINAGVTF